MSTGLQLFMTDFEILKDVFKNFAATLVSLRKVTHTLKIISLEIKVFDLLDDLFVKHHFNDFTPNHCVWLYF